MTADELVVSVQPYIAAVMALCALIAFSLGYFIVKGMFSD